MSKKLHSDQEIGAPVDEVFGVLSEATWAELKARELHDGSRVVSREQKPDGGVRLVVSRELPAGVPGFLERFLPQDGRVVQTDDWGAPLPDGTRAGTWHVDLPGAPATMGGTMRVEPRTAGSAYVVDGEITVKVPLVGGKAEGFVADMFAKLSRKEADVIRGAVGS